MDSSLTGECVQAIALLKYLPYALYTAAGPLAWAYGLGALRTERSRMMRPELLNQPLPEPPPRVSIVIPARNEEQAIRDCVRAALNQDYPDFKVIVVDDRSTDATGAILDELARDDSRLAVLHVNDSPPVGWSGKNHALAQAMKLVEGTRLLFLDADCMLARGTLRATVAAAEHRRVDLVSLLPGVAAENIWEKTVGPATALLGSILDRGLREPYAYGWFMLFLRSSYEKVGGHAALGELFDDDKILAMRLRAQGMRSRVYWGVGYATLRLGRSLPVMMRGFARNLSSLSRNRPWRAMFLLAFILLGCLSAYPAAAIAVATLLTRGWSVYRGLWLASSVVHLGVMTTAFAAMYRWGGGTARSALALPITLLFCLAICIRAVWLTLGGTVKWKETEYRVEGG